MTTESVFERLGAAIFKRRSVLLGLGALALAASGYLAIGAFPLFKGGGFDDPSSESSQLLGELHTALGRDRGTLVALFTSRNDLTIDDPKFQSAALEVLARVKGGPSVGRILHIWNLPLPQFRSKDAKSTFALVGLDADKPTQQKLCAVLRPKFVSDVLDVRLGGYPAVFEEINRQVRQDLKTAELLTFPIVAILLILIFGSLVAASLPLLVGIATIIGAFAILRGVTLFDDVSIYSINIVTMLGLGLAIDYSLFMVSRFREEMQRRSGDVRSALKKTMDTAGRTVLFSGITVAISLLSLLVFPVMFLRSMGIGGTAVVLVAMLTSLTILPALLAALGPKVNALSVRRKKPGSQSPRPGSTFWYRTSMAVMKRPLTVALLTTALLVWLGLPFLRVRFATPDARSLPMGSESRVVLETLARDFPKNETEPIEILVLCPKDATQAESLATLVDLCALIRKEPGVTRIDSLVTQEALSQGRALSGEEWAAVYGMADPRIQTAKALLSKGNAAVVRVLYETPSSSEESQELVRRLRALQVPDGYSRKVGGKPAELVDFLATLGERIPLAFAIIVSVIFVLLFLMLGSLVIPLKAVIVNILSLSVSFGALVWIFQDGHLADWLGFTPLGSIDGTQPVLIFAVAFGLSMDYEVFLLSRVKEQYDRNGDPKAAVASGVEKTGGIITSAALLLVVVIGAFTTGKVVFIKQIGIGLGLAVLLDATIVRTLLVPAGMALMGKFNWWAPKPLLAFYHWLGLAETEKDDTPFPNDVERESWVKELPVAGLGEPPPDESMP